MAERDRHQLRHGEWHHRLQLTGRNSLKWHRSTVFPQTIAPVTTVLVATRSGLPANPAQLMKDSNRIGPARGGIFSPFLQMWLTWGPPWSLVAFFYSVSFSSTCIATQISDCYWPEENFLSLIGFHYRETRKRGREKSSGHVHLFNILTIWAMDRNSGQPQVKLSLFAQYFFKKSTTAAY